MALQTHLLDIKHYLHEDINTRVYQTVDPNSPLHNNDVVHCHTLVATVRHYNHEYVRGIMTVYFSLTVNPEGVTYASAVHNFYRLKVQKNSYCMLKLNGRSWCRSIKVLKDEDGVERATETLRMCYAFRVDGKPILPALSK